MSSPVIDHFLLLGPKSFPSELKYETFSNNSFEVGLIDSFPKIDQLPEHLEHINLWCFPDGYQVLDSYKNMVNNGDVVKSRTGKPSATIREEMTNSHTVYHFILTDSEYNKRYCSALMFYEKYDLADAYPGFNQGKVSSIDRNLVFCPKVLCIISQVSILDVHAQILEVFFEKTLKARHFQYMPVKREGITLKKGLFNEFSELQVKNGKERGESIFFERFSELKDVYSGNNNGEINVCESDFFEFFISFFYYCLPVNSMAEDYSVVVEGLDETSKTPLLAYNLSKGQSLYEKQFRTLFSKMQVNNVLKLVKFLLLEKSVLIFAKKTNDIIAVTEALLSLLSPLKWTCIYAPLLPISMSQILQAVIPYLVGMNSKHKETVLNSMDLSDKVIVDLEEDNITYSQDVISYYFLKNPLQINKPLLKSVFLPKCIVDRMTRKLNKHIRKMNNPGELGEKELLETCFGIKAAFGDFMLGIINNYTPFFLFSRDFNDKNVVSSEIFDQEAYLRIFTQEDRVFMRDFTAKTMMFNRFLEDSYKILYFSDFLKKDLETIGLEDTKSFINGVKKILKTLNKSTISGKFEGFFDLESLQHLQRLIDLDKDLRLQLALENLMKPKTLRTLPFFIKYFQTMVESDTSSPLSKKSNEFLLLKCFHQSKILDLSQSNSQNTILNLYTINNNKPQQEDELMEFSSINLPIQKTTLKPQDELNNPEMEEKKGLIEAILLKEMEICMKGPEIKKKAQRKTTIFETKAPLNNSDLDIEQILTTKQGLKLKKAFSEQPELIISGKMNRSEKFSNVNKNFKPVAPRNEEIEEKTKKIPVLNVNSNGEREQKEENREFSIFSYLISDMMKEEEVKMPSFPKKKQGLTLKRHLTTGVNEERKHGFNEKQGNIKGYEADNSRNVWKSQENGNANWGKMKEENLQMFEAVENKTKIQFLEPEVNRNKSKTLGNNKSNSFLLPESVNNSKKENENSSKPKETFEIQVKEDMFKANNVKSKAPMRIIDDNPIRLNPVENKTKIQFPESEITKTKSNTPGNNNKNQYMQQESISNSKKENENKPKHKETYEIQVREDIFKVNEVKNRAPMRIIEDNFQRFNPVESDPKLQFPESEITRPKSKTLGNNNRNHYMQPESISHSKKENENKPKTKGICEIQVKEDLLKAKEIINNVPLERILNSQRKEGYLGNIAQKYNAITPKKGTGNEENSGLIGFKSKGFVKEALVERTNMDMGDNKSHLDQSVYDYNCRLIKKKSTGM